MATLDEEAPSTSAAAPSKSATINDVARVAGVAASTISRALSIPGRVKVSTREHIERVASELNYVPNGNARALISGRTGTVAVLVTDIYHRAVLLRHHSGHAAAAEGGQLFTTVG
jgi:LacI family transcriptional regulator, repressor for deo operon, udp, cdd, tsx, nupC, and nupG